MSDVEFTRDGLVFTLRPADEVLTVSLPSDLYWDAWNTVHHRQTGLATQRGHDVVAIIKHEAKRLWDEGHRFRIDISTVHMGALAHLYAKSDGVRPPSP